MVKNAKEWLGGRGYSLDEIPALLDEYKVYLRKEWLYEQEKVTLGLPSVIESFNHEKMERIVPHYIVGLKDNLNCNELRFIVETFLAQNPKYKKEVERLNSL